MFAVIAVATTAFASSPALRDRRHLRHRRCHHRRRHGLRADTLLALVAVAFADAATSCVPLHAPPFVHADVSPALSLKTVTAAANYETAALPGNLASPITDVQVRRQAW